MNVRLSSTRVLLCSVVMLSALGASAQYRKALGASAPRTPAHVVPDEGIAYVVTDRNGATSCRDASPAEALRINAPHGQTTRPLGQSGGIRTNAAGGLDIVLRGTTQLDANPEAKGAFERAAQVWESKINTPVTIIVEVDFGTKFFDQTFDENVIAQASTPSYLYDAGDYPGVRAKLIALANNTAEVTILNLLPALAVPTDDVAGDVTRLGAGGPLLRALGEFGPIPAETDPRPKIGFNSKFQYDFDPSDGIAFGKKDFEGVVVHEIGHMLGFTSRVGSGELPNPIIAPSILDLFRFRPGVNNGTFGTAQRVLSTGGEQIFFAGGDSLGFSTGNPRGENGDERQASHWKDDALTGRRVGIMDPTLANATRSELTANDLVAFGMIGWEIDGASGCTETEPNEIAATASELAFGTPCNGNAASGDTSTYTYTDGTITDGVEDLFKLTLPAPAKISATLTFATTASDLDIILFTVTGSTLDIPEGGISNGSGPTETFTTDDVLPAGTYYLGVSAYAGSSSYSISAQATGGPVAPAAPTGLTATAVGSTQINLTWADNANNETEYRIERQIVGGAFADIGSAPENATSYNATGLTAGTQYSFRVRARNTAGDSAYSNTATATTNVTTGTCVASATTVCLLNDRFRVKIDYFNPIAGQNGTFVAARLLQGAQNPDTALFGFSSPQAVEVVVRIQDTRPFAPRFDVYYGGMTDFPYTVTVSDMQTGITRQYVNVAGNVGGGADRTSFPAN